MKEFVDLKQMRPEKLTKPEEFRGWRDSFENYCELVENGIKEVLRKIGNERKEMSEDEMKQACGGKDKHELDRRLHNALLGYTEGEARRLVRTAGVGQGLRAYQDLCRYYDLKTDASENKLTCELLGMAGKPAKNLKEVRQMMIDMEARRTRLEEMGAEVPKANSMRAILVGLLDEETKRHIGDVIGNIEYNEAKKKVTAYITTNLNLDPGSDDDDMGLGRLAEEERAEKEAAAAEEKRDKEHEHQEDEEWDPKLAALKGQGKETAGAVASPGTWPGIAEPKVAAAATKAEAKGYQPYPTVWASAWAKEAAKG